MSYIYYLQQPAMTRVWVSLDLPKPDQPVMLCLHSTWPSRPELAGTIFTALFLARSNKWLLLIEMGKFYVNCNYRIIFLRFKGIKLVNGLNPSQALALSK